MHTRELVEVAGLVALNGPTLVDGAGRVDSDCLEQYWAASRCRCEDWSRALKAHASAAADTPGTPCELWIETRAVFDELFVSEMLTRTWTAVLVAGDQCCGQHENEAIARSVFNAQLDVRQRALQLLLEGRGISTRQAVSLNRLRRRAERWTDVLIGGLMHLGDVREFAFVASRAEDFSHDLARKRNLPGGRQAWRLTLVSLRNAFQAGLAPDSANPQANARIASSILGCFPEEVFDSTGIVQSPWMMRLSATTSDTQGMLMDLLNEAIPEPTVEQPSPLRRPRL